MHQYHWNKVRGTRCQVLKPRNEYKHKQNNCDSSKPGYVQLSNGLIQSGETYHTFAV